MSYNTKRALATVTLGAAASLGMLTTLAHADSPEPGCHRLDAAQLDGSSGSSADSYNLACSGAETRDIGMPEGNSKYSADSEYFADSE
ncbi:hypothetical protein ACFW6F_22010 [Streptomyces sp. NPDC058746]|uniref:hypothetical protein n=1 Tax=Streptomyces sp. NPDC058746 TaxID=3346622 RepID=UPI0036A64D07